MLNFKELNVDGNDLEVLIREILLVQGLQVHWSGRGPDGGKDLICHEERSSYFMKDKKTWLIQCKHKAHSESSVGTADLDDIIDSCTQHAAQGYLLVCSTYPSSAVVNRLEGISSSSSTSIVATYWDASKIEQILTTPRMWKIAQAFFPNSSQQYGLSIYATENPNHWIANFKGYHFHVSNRIGSVVDFHFSSIEDRIKEIEAIELPAKQFIRIRAVYFNDKIGSYTWFLDYMHPREEEPALKADWIAYKLGDGHVLDDGQIYNFDVVTRSYIEMSDHYDKDHYDYYKPYLYNYSTGSFRDPRTQNLRRHFESWFESERTKKTFREDSFNKLVETMRKIDFISLIRSENSTIEDLDKFTNLRDWSEIIEKLEINDDRFFSACFIIETENENNLLLLISCFPQEYDCSFKLKKPYMFMPKVDGSLGSEFIEQGNDVYQLTIEVSGSSVPNSYLGRQMLNEYFGKIKNRIEKYLDENK